MLFNFTVCIAIVVSIFRISKISRPAIAVSLLLLITGIDVALLREFQGEKKHLPVDITGRFYQASP